MMNHPERAFSFKEIQSEDDLVDAMFNHKWPLCYSFYHKKLLYMSDGEREDLQEYVVIAIDRTEGRFGIQGREIGRIKTANMSQSDASNIIRQMNDSRYAAGNLVQFLVEPKWHHSCHLCGLDEEYS